MWNSHMTEVDAGSTPVPLSTRLFFVILKELFYNSNLKSSSLSFFKYLKINSIHVELYFTEGFINLKPKDMEYNIIYN